MVPVAVANVLRAAITQLSGVSIARFAGAASSRLGVTVAGSTAGMAQTLSSYISNNPMSAGLVAAALASSTVNFDVAKLIDMWDNSEEGIPENVRYLLEQIEQVEEVRQQSTGDGDPDTVMGLDIPDLRKAALVLANGDRQIELLLRHFGNIDEVIAIRNALFSVDDEQLQLYKERHSGTRHY